MSLEEACSEQEVLNKNEVDMYKARCLDEKSHTNIRWHSFGLS